MNLQESVFLFFRTIALCLVFGASSSFATIHYVAKAGTMVPPYTTWETAAWFIELAADISAIGDTVMIESGDYQVYSPIYLLNPGITLMGVGMDSTRLLGKVGLDYMLVPADDDVIRDLTFIGDPITEYGSELFGSGRAILIPGVHDRISFEVEDCRFTKFKFDAITILDDVDNCRIRNCDFYDNRWTSLSLGHLGNYYVENCTFRQHWYYGADGYIDFMTSMGKKVVRGCRFEGSTGEPVINSDFWTWGYLEVVNNIFYDNSGYGGILEASVAQLIVRNNSVYYNDGNTVAGRVFWLNLAITDSAIVENNAIVASHGQIEVLNIDRRCRIANNMIYSRRCLPPEVLFTLTVNNPEALEMSDNLFLDPMFVDPDSGDLRLQAGSPAINQGTVGGLDVDSSRCDIGAFGGPVGSVYAYENYPPAKPRVFSGSVTNNELSLRWLANTENDLVCYQVYCDNQADITTDTEHLLASVFLTPESTFNGLDADSEYVVFTFNLPTRSQNAYYAVRAFDFWGLTSELTDSYLLTATGLEDEHPPLPEKYSLSQNFPNPFNAETKINLHLPESKSGTSETEVIIYNNLGQKVRTLVSGFLSVGDHELVWRADDDAGAPVASGVYFCQVHIKTGQPTILSRKLVLLK